MKDSGKTLLRIISIIFIVFGAIATIFSLIALVAAIASGIIMAIIATVLLVIGSLIEFIIGIMGLKRSGDKSSANFFVVTGYILGILMLIIMIMNFTAWSLIGFVLPVLYIVGGYMLKKTET